MSDSTEHAYEKKMVGQPVAPGVALPRAKKPLPAIRRIVNIVLLAFLIFLAYLFGYRHVRFFKVPSQSMSPTLYSGDFIISIANTSYQRGDVIVVRDPHDHSEYLVKRLVGAPGDRVAVEGGVLFVNGYLVREPYVGETMDAWFPPTRIPDGSVFILGDNRNYSEDSLVWGQPEEQRHQFREASIFSPDNPLRVSGQSPAGAGIAMHRPAEKSSRPEWAIDLDDIVGRALFIYLPSRRVRPIQSYEFPLEFNADMPYAYDRYLAYAQTLARTRDSEYGIDAIEIAEAWRRVRLCASDHTQLLRARLFEARAWAARGERTKAHAALREAEKLEPGNPDTRRLGSDLGLAESP